MKPVLILPLSNNDSVETNLEEDRRIAFELSIKTEVPPLKHDYYLFASDYFRAGWDAAIAKYSKPVVVVTEPEEVFNPSATDIQIAAILGLTGTTEQKKEALSFFNKFLRKITC